MKRTLSLLTLTAALLVASAMTLAAPATAKANKVDAGGYTSCAIVEQGIVKCWGRGDSGALGNGADVNENEPVRVTGLTGAKQISTSETPCALLGDGTVRCWGPGDYGQLGNGSSSGTNVPVKVKGIRNAVQVSSGYLHSCAVLSTGQIKCWGNNANGQLGNNDMGNNSDVPVLVKGIDNAVQVDAGNEDHTCAKLSTGKVKCWGLNNHGQLGNDDMGVDSDVPVSPVGLGKVKKVITGYYETCAIMTDDAVKCWGENAEGELGIGSTGGDFDTPQDVVSLSNVRSMSQENDSACAVLFNGTMKCWGDNGSGQWGDGNSGTQSDTPGLIAGVQDVKGVSAGWYHTCIHLESKVVECAGAGTSGELGQGAFADSLTFVKTLF